MRKILTKRGLKKSILSVVIALILVITMIPMDSIVAHAENAKVAVSYRYPVYNTPNVPSSGIKEWKDGCQNCIPITADDTTLGKAGETTWYVVNSAASEDLTIWGGVTVNGAVNIILKDGAKLMVNASSEEEKAGIAVTGDNNSLTVYGQTIGDGELVAFAGAYGAGIGGGRSSAGNNITINGGLITAYGGDSAAGIGGGMWRAGTNIVINGGSISAYGGATGAGIGGGCDGAGNNITINGGSIYADSVSMGAGIGGGLYAEGSKITINGGNIVAVSEEEGAGIGGGYNGNGSDISINDVELLSVSIDGLGSVIGGGWEGTGSNIAISPSLLVKAGDSEGSCDVIDPEGSTWGNLLYRKKYLEICVNSHVHEFEDKWSSDANNHWHACISQDASGACLRESKAALASHIWKKGVCETCGYQCTHEYAPGNICDVCKDTISDNTSAISYIYPEYVNANESNSGIREWKEGTQYCHEIDSSDTTIGIVGRTTWYVVNSAAVNNLTIDSTVTVVGDVNIILVDGALLKVNGEYHNAGIKVTGDDNRLTIYGQSEGNGHLIAKGGSHGAGIGGGLSQNGSNITINGGKITATGGGYGAGIGGGYNGVSNNIIFNRGEITATCGNRGVAGIGNGYDSQGVNDFIIAANAKVLAGDSADTAEKITLVEATWAEQLSGKKYVNITFGFEHEHKFAEEWSSDESFHWHKCTVTGASDDCLTENGAAKAPHGSWKDGKCGTCGYECAHSSWLNGKCSICGYDCTHSEWLNEKCIICGFDCIHGGITEGICKICGRYISAPYRYPEYITPNDATSGIQAWKYGSQNCVLITEKTTTLGVAGETTWYIVNSVATENLTLLGGITVNGNVNIILADGAKLTVKGSDNKAGIAVTGDGNSLTIYGQSLENGQLIVSGGIKGAGIGGNTSESGNNIIINGGSIIANGGKGAAGIGGGQFGDGSNIVVNDGSVTVYGGAQGAGIGGGVYNAGYDITINGGYVTATGGTYGAGIGGGRDCGGYNFTINGGTVEAFADEDSMGIGGGWCGTLDNIIIKSGLYIMAGADKKSAALVTNGESSLVDLLWNEHYVCTFNNHVHKYEEAWLSNEYYHWHRCISAGASNDCLTESGAAKSYHGSWKDGKCGTCGYECAHNSWEDGRCKTCGYKCAHSSWEDGRCENCGYECKHGSWEDGRCKNCGAQCYHVSGWENGKCKTCGYKCAHNSGWVDGKCNTCGDACAHESVARGACEICGLQGFVSVSYKYPIYNTENEPKSGVKEWKEGTHDCIPITSATTTLGADGNSSWYVVNIPEAENLSITRTVTVNGAVNIILVDGACLRVKGSANNAGINVTGDCNSLTIYGQSLGSGQLFVSVSDGGAGIGGGYMEDGNDITINGGCITSNVGKYGAGIGGGYMGDGSHITINGGYITSNGGENGAGIGGGSLGDGSYITINGGCITSNGGEYGAGIGGGALGDGSNIIINGGNVTATGGVLGTVIGGGLEGTAKDIIISSELDVFGGDNKNSAINIAIGDSTWAEQLSGKSYVRIIHSAVSFSGCSLSLSGDIGINIYFMVEADTIEANEYKIFIKNKDSILEMPLVDDTEELSGGELEGLADSISGDASGSKSCVCYYSIPAKDYNKELTCMVVMDDITVNTFTVRVSDYIDAIQNNSSKYDEQTINFVNALEKYCAAADCYFSTDVQEEQKAQYDYSVVADKLSGYGADYANLGESYLGSSLVLKDKVAIRFYYKYRSGLYALGVTKIEYEGGIFYYEIDNISPADYDVARLGGYSVYSYLLAGISCDDYSYSLRNLLCAMYEYGVAAEAM